MVKSLILDLLKWAGMIIGIFLMMSPLFLYSNEEKDVSNRLADLWVAISIAESAWAPRVTLLIRQIAKISLEFVVYLMGESYISAKAVTSSLWLSFSSSFLLLSLNSHMSEVQFAKSVPLDFGYKMLQMIDLTKKTALLYLACGLFALYVASVRIPKIKKPSLFAMYVALMILVTVFFGTAYDIINEVSIGDFPQPFEMLIAQFGPHLGQINIILITTFGGAAIDLIFFSAIRYFLQKLSNSTAFWPTTAMLASSLLMCYILVLGLSANVMLYGRPAPFMVRMLFKSHAIVYFNTVTYRILADVGGTNLLAIGVTGIFFLVAAAFALNLVTWPLLTRITSVLGGNITLTKRIIFLTGALIFNFATGNKVLKPLFDWLKFVI